jgi:hypothetical protein
MAKTSLAESLLPSTARPAGTRAVLESALRARKLDRTLSSAMPLAVPPQPSDCSPFQIGPLDACLQGGLPHGQLCEIAGPQSSGRTTLLLSLMSAATARGGIAALIDTTDRFDVASAVAAGIDLERLLWVRGYATAQSDRANGALSALERAIKALNLILQAGGFSVVAIDLGDVPSSLLKRLPFTTWLRLQRAIEGRDTTCVLLVPEPLARSAGGLTVALTGEASWHGQGRFNRLKGMDVSARVQSPRRYANGEVRFGADAVE